MRCVRFDAEVVDNVNIRACVAERAELSASLVGGISFIARIAEQAQLLVNAVDSVTFDAVRVCDVNTGQMLVVSPEVVWLNEGNDYSADFEVVSNVDWKIE